MRDVNHLGMQKKKESSLCCDVGLNCIVNRDVQQMRVFLLYYATRKMGDCFDRKFLNSWHEQWHLELIIFSFTFLCNIPAIEWRKKLKTRIQVSIIVPVVLLSFESEEKRIVNPGSFYEM